LFGDGAKATTFKLTHTAASPMGVTIAHYTRAGGVETGDYGIEPPNAAEQARRARMQREG
ncbi:MAG: hypothetical protein R3C16_10395, partial [Hyphomonadaceae bacterium]